MLSPLQIERLWRHCESINDGYKDWHGPGEGMCGDEGPEYFEYIRNKGWVEALRLVLETDTKSIKNKPLKKQNDES